MPESFKSVLIAEDDPLVLDVMTRICKELFAEVVFRERGDEAMQALATGSFDLLITDLRMPGENGLALLAESRRRAPTRPLLLVSGYADIEATNEARRLGADVLHKPFGAHALRQAIRALCSNLPA
jgi:DNA-binding response OmpR family regulator